MPLTHNMPNEAPTLNLPKSRRQNNLELQKCLVVLNPTKQRLGIWCD
jgi:hypothetical protein